MTDKEFQPTDHFIPDHAAWGEPTTFLEDLVTVPIRRVKHVPSWTGDPPFLVYSCGWHHFNSQGALTEEKFKKDVEGALRDLARDINTHEVFLAYPITHVPPVTENKAFYDWIGAAYPFDLRAVVMYEEIIPIMEGNISKVDDDGDPIYDSGFKFFLNTLISTEMKKHVKN